MNEAKTKRRVGILLSTTITAAAIAFAVTAFTGCQTAGGDVKEGRKLTAAAQGEEGMDVTNVTEEVLPDGTVNRVTTTATHVAEYREDHRADLGAKALASKQGVGGFNFDKRSAVGSRTKTGVDTYTGETQPEAISAALGPVSELAKVTLAAVGGPAGALLVNANPTVGDVDAAINALPENAPAPVLQELEAIKARLSKVESAPGVTP